MTDVQRLCQQFAEILHGKPSFKNGACSVLIHRPLHVKIQGRKTKSALSASFTFESLDLEGNALNLGEVVLLDHEVPGFNHMLTSQGIIVSAIHNHWLFTEPNILYIHFQSVEPPLTFAQKVIPAMQTLTD